MKRNLKLKLVALVATFSCTSTGQGFAQQSTEDMAGSTLPAIVQPYEVEAGTFGAVQPAPSIPAARNYVPPIVDSEEIGWQTGKIVDASNVPPIVTPDQLEVATVTANDTLPPIVSASEATQAPTTLTPNFGGGMLSPMKAQPMQPQTVAKSENEIELGTPIAPAMPKSSEVAEPSWPAPAPSLAGMEMPSPAPKVILATTQTTIPEETGSGVQQVQWDQQATPTGYSAAGVAFYPQESAPPAPAEGAVVTPPVVSVPPIISADSQQAAPVDTGMSPSDIPVAPMQTPQAMPAMPSYETGQSYITTPMTSAPAIVDASTMGSTISDCLSCGTTGCFSDEQIADQFGCCGSVYSARRYLIAEALYFDRDDGVVANSNFGALSNFDWDWGWRVTLGTREDATQGREFSYMGTLPLEQTATRTDALARINAIFTTGGGFSGVENTAFRNAVSQTESKETELHSLEFNRVKWGWDVIKTYVGLRYIYVDDQYRMFSQNNVGETGLFQMQTQNNMIGPHIGGELFYDVGYRLSYSLFGKAGGYLNFNRVETDLVNAGAQFLNAEDNSLTISGSLELGLISHFQLSRSARLRLGYNVLWLGEVASVSDNFPAVLTPFTGTDTSDSDDMFFHGASFGLEIYR